MVLVWGVHPVETSYFDKFDNVVDSAIEVSEKEGFVVKGQQLIVTAGVPFGTPGTTNILRIVKVE